MPTRARTSTIAAALDPQVSSLFHHRLLGARLYVHSWVRYGVALAILFGVLASRVLPGSGIAQDDWLVFIAAFLGSYNSIAVIFLRHYRSAEASLRAHGFLKRLLYITIFLDYACLSAIVWLLGGAHSPFLGFFVLHLIVSILLVARRHAWICLVMAVGFLSTLVIGEWSGVLTRHPVIGHSSGVEPLDDLFYFTVLAVYLSLFGLSTYLVFTLMRLLRDGERELRAANESLRQLSRMRRDFLHIAVHNLKAPVGAVTMFLRNLRSGLVGPISEQQGMWVDRSLRRLDGLSHFLHDIELLSILEQEQLAAQATPVVVSEMLEQIVDEHCDIAAARDQTISAVIEPGLPRVTAVERLLREAVVNYVTNALKYTPDGGTIRVGAHVVDELMRIEVRDNGIGIAPEDQSRLFGEFVRVGQGHPLAAQVEGSGLGLSIARRIAESHGGSVWCISTPDVGSTFGLDLPLGGAA